MLKLSIKSVVKKVGKIFLYFFSILLLVLVSLYLVFRTSTVQTWAAQKLTNYLSSEVNSTIRIGGVDIELFKKIVLEDVYVEDMHKDTLLFAPLLKLDIAVFQYKKRKLVFESIILDKTVAKIIRYENENDFNYQFLIDAFSSTDTLSKDTMPPWELKFNGLELVDVDFTYNDRHDTSRTEGINYSDVRTTHTNALIKNIYFDKDTIYADIHHLSAIEKSGFELKELSSQVVFSPAYTRLNNLKIKTEKSDISTDLLMRYSTYDDYNNFIEKVKMDASFNRSIINMDDISYFSSELKGVDNTLLLSGKIKGRVNDLKGRNMVIEFGPTSFFKGDFSLKGLPEIENTFIVLDIDGISTNKKDIEALPVPPFDLGKKLSVPDNILLLGQMNFKGNYTGFINDFTAYGTFTTALGRIDMDLSMAGDTASTAKTTYSGKIKSYNFDIGKYLYLEKTLGKISIDASVDGAGLSAENVVANLKGKITSIDFNNYSYQNLDVEGELARKMFKGKLDVNDENLKLNFTGNVDFSGKLPILSFNARVKEANLAKVNLVTNDSISFISATLDVDMVGNNIDNMIGEANVTNVKYKDSNGEYLMTALAISINESAGNKNIKVISDFVNIDVNGNYSLTELPKSLTKVVTSYLPVIGGKESNAITSRQNFTFSVLCKRTDAFTRLFMPTVKISDGTVISGSFDSDVNKISVEGQSAVLSISGVEIKGWRFKVDQKENELYVQTMGDHINLTDSLKVYGPSVYAITNSGKNAIDVEALWSQHAEMNNQSNLKLTSSFESLTKSQTKILSAAIYISDSLWALATTDNYIMLDTSSVIVKDVAFRSGGQEVILYGAISEEKSDRIFLKLSDFDLATLNPFISSSGTNLKGTVSGETSIADFYNKFLFSSNLAFTGLVFNNEPIGNGVINSIWDKNSEGISVDGKFSRGIVTNIDFKGNYYPSKKENSIDLAIDLQAIKLQMFESYLKGYCSNLSGQMSGSMVIKGTPAKPLLNGKLNVNTKRITIDYLNTTYGFSGDVYIDNNSFGVKELLINDFKSSDDQKKIGVGTALVTGKIYHENFNNIQLDIDLKADKFQCLNTTENINELYYGKANVTGIVNFYGYTNNIVIDASVKTERGTQFNIPLSSTEEAGETGFITFKKEEQDTIAIAKKYKVELNGMRLNFDLEVTPAAEVQLIFDAKIGDVIRARGNGNIKMVISTLGDFSMYGDYTITEGDYLFTLQNVVNKRFDIENGGTVKWTGDPNEATANITAVYRQTASIHPFFPADSSRRRYLVDCKLKLTDRLMSPNISFDIDFPTLDNQSRQQIKSYINTEQEMNRQVFSLLILKSFVTPPELAGLTTSESVASGAGANSTELLSNQLSNWLSQISNDFDIGVNYRRGDELSNEELEVALSTQILNDKVTIDGNLGVGSGNTGTDVQQNSSNIAGDVNVEYKITDDGKLRVRAFNKSNDNRLLSTSIGPYTQGVGVFYREEFNSLGELYRRYLGKLKNEKKKQ